MRASRSVKLYPRCPPGPIRHAVDAGGRASARRLGRGYRDGLLASVDNLHASCEAALRRYLPALLAEGAGRNYEPPPSDDFIFGLLKPLDGSLYVATEAFLLRDCSERFVNRRIEKLGQFGFMASGSTILISNHGLERLCQVHFTYTLDLPPGARPDSLAHAMVYGIDKVLENLVRYETWPVFSTTPMRPPFASAATYFDYPSQNYGGTRDASIELARWRGARFCAATVFEHAQAADELDVKAELVRYWVLLPAGAANLFQPAR